MPRIPMVPAQAPEGPLAEVFGRFADAGRDVPELYRTLGNAPALLKAWTDFAWPLRNECSTDRGLRELVIMRVAQLTQADTEWAAHWDMAVRSGNPPEKLAALGSWRASDRFDELERAVLAFTDEITADLGVSDEVFQAVADRLAPGEVVEITLTAAFYSCVSRVLRTLGVEHPMAPEARAALEG